MASQSFAGPDFAILSHRVVSSHHFVLQTSWGVLECLMLAYCHTNEHNQIASAFGGVLERPNSRLLRESSTGIGTKKERPTHRAQNVIDAVAILLGWLIGYARRGLGVSLESPSAMQPAVGRSDFRSLLRRFVTTVVGWMTPGPWLEPIVAASLNAIRSLSMTIDSFPHRCDGACDWFLPEPPPWHAASRWFLFPGSRPILGVCTIRSNPSFGADLNGPSGQFAAHLLFDRFR